MENYMWKVLEAWMYRMPRLECKRRLFLAAGFEEIFPLFILFLYRKNIHIYNCVYEKDNHAFC